MVGGGPAGLECALALGQRGYRVILAEASQDLEVGSVGKVACPVWPNGGVFRDYRVLMLERLANVTIYRENPLSADEILSSVQRNQFDYSHVLLQTDHLGGGTD